MASFIVEAEVRTGKGTAASRRARRDGKVPVVVYGGGEDEQYLLVDHNKIMRQLEVEAFHSALVQIQLEGDLQRAILRDYQVHPYKAQVMHLDFQRVSRKDTITMNVPFRLVGEEDSPGVNNDKGIMTQNMSGVDVTCLGIDLPEFIEVNVGELELGGSVHLGGVQLPENVNLASTIQESDLELPVASVLAPKGPSAAALAEEAEAAEAAAAAAGEEGGDSAEGASEE